MAIKRGRILRDTNAGPGLVTVDAKQYSFTLEGMWISEIPPRPGMVVEVTFDEEGKPVSLRAVPEKELAIEQAQQALAGARRHGAALTTGLRSRIGLPVMVVEALMLIAFFLLPCMRVGNGYMNQSFNGWDAIGLDPATASTSNHGILSLLALALFVPIVMPFVQKPWSRWLYAAPFGFVVIAFVSLSIEIQHAGSSARQAITDTLGTNAVGAQFGNPMAGMFSPGVGVFIALLCSIYLLTRAFKATSVTAPGASL